ncbi:hemocytin-like [Rana temporaria]|uniref:hemocytin-like n=1 Tax=Rana temporaria TaxID=8407 RepID=UPI001AADFB9C|nr:hemocytin-like [Rana temporaria]
MAFDSLDWRFKGTKYETIPGQCCGECVQNGCVVTLSTGEKVVLSDGNDIADDNYCTKYLCTQVNGFYVTNIERDICDYSSSADCGPGQEFVKDPGQCCGRCKQTQCVVISANGTVILLMEEQTILSPDDKCISYTCMISMGNLNAVKEKERCEHQSQSDCGIGQEFVKDPGQCCGRCKQTQCVVIFANGTVILLMEKQTIPSPDDKCIYYTCMISMGNLNAVEHVKICELQSQSDCGIGYQYQIPSDQCCGKCVPTSCVYITPDGKTILLKESENWKSDDSCTTVTCQKINGQFFSSSATETCTYTSASKDCGLGYVYQTVPNQCCGNCVQNSCVFTTANGVLTTLEDGKTLSEPSDICIVYNCKKTNGQFLTLAEKKICEHVSAQDCKTGEEYQKVPNQCCGQCVQTQCLIIVAGNVNKTLNVCY